MNKTIIDKIWEAHVVSTIENGPCILYIDRHYIHEVTSPQAFSGLKKRNTKVLRPKQIVATADHNIPTVNQHLPIKEELSRIQVQKLEENCKENNIQLFNIGNKNNGIVHVIGPELGFTLPGMTIVCGDSHTSTHGAFGCIAFGIGTSEVEQVMATQCLLQEKPKRMKVEVHGVLAENVSAKDLIISIIAQYGTNAGSGHFIEFCGETISEMSMESRMTICNMSIEMGARGGLIAPDETTFDYLSKCDHLPNKDFSKQRMDFWKSLKSDEHAIFDKVIMIDASKVQPMITYGTNPSMAIPVNGTLPLMQNVTEKENYTRALNYMGFSEGEILLGKKIQHVFIGSCTNSRIEDLRIVAKYIQGKKVATAINAMIVPGSQKVRKQAIEEGLDKVFIEAGFQFREPGCSACLGMNEDKIPSGEYCVSTSNRNFEGRQGQGARTMLASPLLAAAIAVEGSIVLPALQKKSVLHEIVF